VAGKAHRTRSCLIKTPDWIFGETAALVSIFAIYANFAPITLRCVGRYWHLPAFPTQVPNGCSWTNNGQSSVRTVCTENLIRID
jgi:hypothetical protein